MRFFIALEIPDNNTKQLARVQESFEKIIPEAKITDNEKIHLTLAFIGEKPDDFKERLEQIIVKAVGGVAPFEVTPAYIDAFPNLHHPRIFWVGPKGDIDKLMLIRERIKDGLVEIGITVDERRYTPHIAIAKINDYRLSKAAEVALQHLMSETFDPIRIESIKLFESIPEHGFHTHNTLAEIKLI